MQSRLRTSGPGPEFSFCPSLLTPAGTVLNSQVPIVVRIPGGVFKVLRQRRPVVGVQQMTLVLINKKMYKTKELHNFQRRKEETFKRKPKD